MEKIVHLFTDHWRLSNLKIRGAANATVEGPFVRMRTRIFSITFLFMF